MTPRASSAIFQNWANFSKHVTKYGDVASVGNHLNVHVFQNFEHDSPVSMIRPVEVHRVQYTFLLLLRFVSFDDDVFFNIQINQESCVFLLSEWEVMVTHHMQRTQQHMLGQDFVVKFFGTITLENPEVFFQAPI